MTRGSSRTWAVVVAAGTGSRFGGAKQFVDLGGRPVAAWAVAAAAARADGVVLVAPAGYDGSALGASVVAAGGATRSSSVRAGLAAVPDDASRIVVHDAARPFASDALFGRVLGALDSADAAIPAVSLGDTLKRVSSDGAVVSTVDRTGLVATQTPQAFQANAIRRAHRGDPEATDDAALVERGGGHVVAVDGEVGNGKITVAEDLELARRRIATARVGHGFDIHPFSNDASRPLRLGGILIAGAPGLDGHSDADAVCHSVSDALLGAAGLPDIGRLFPDDDPALAGADSAALLANVVARVRGEGWIVLNADCTIVADRPRLVDHLDEIAARLSVLVGAPVAVKAKRAEGMGALGRGEGIACWAVACLA